MSQKPSGYDRKPGDLYETPAWATEALNRAIAGRGPSVLNIWEPACGSGKMAIVLRLMTDGRVHQTDISHGADFLAAGLPDNGYWAIVTNPPYGPRGMTATAFIEHALMLTQMSGHGLVAMLLRVDFDSAKTRSRLFGDHPAFAHKLVLRKRINWFETGGHGSTENHAWFVWDWAHDGPPTIGYAP